MNYVIHLLLSFFSYIICFVTSVNFQSFTLAKSLILLIMHLFNVVLANIISFAFDFGGLLSFMEGWG